ncbi:hypothetical protein AOR13_920 [Alteromonas stellipolaris LMG 21856]|nr:hypothetical protein AOR13_920 [Alteromonas stellipolaris LMG 21856]
MATTATTVTDKIILFFSMKMMIFLNVKMGAIITDGLP